MNTEAIKSYLLTLQDTICQAVEKEDSRARFIEDNWQHASGGGGRSRALAGGKLFEKAGVNFSHVFGNSLPSAATTSRPELVGRQFQALGISLVLHPDNPFVPTTHANIRFFIAEKENSEPLWWFGGGYDLTPYYGFVEDCHHWHQTAKTACDTFDLKIYPKFKKWCDDYFYLPHRKETRGIGGLFFDDVNEYGFENSFALWRSIGDSFLSAYIPIVKRRKDHPYTDQQKAFQLYRRGRYVEFNLLYDRGTLFGLQSGGRTESILMSLPPLVRWEYNWQPEPGSAEATLYELFLTPQDWLAMPRG